MLIKCFTCRGKIRSILRNTQHLSVRLTWGGGSLSSMKGDYICSPFQPCLPAVYKCHVHPQEFRSFKCMENTTVGRKSPINFVCVGMCVFLCVFAWVVPWRDVSGIFPQQTLREQICRQSSASHSVSVDPCGDCLLLKLNNSRLSTHVYVSNHLPCIPLSQFPFISSRT